MRYFETKDVVKLTEISRESLRFYEKCALLWQPERNSSNYRQYTQGHIDRIFFIKAAQKVGFTLGEIRELLELKLESQELCLTTIAKAQAKIQEIEEKIHTLNQMNTVLADFVLNCQQGDKTQCNFVIKGISSTMCCEIEGKENT